MDIVALLAAASCQRLGLKAELRSQLQMVRVRINTNRIVLLLLVPCTSVTARLRKPYFRGGLLASSTNGLAARAIKKIPLLLAMKHFWIMPC